MATHTKATSSTILELLGGHGPATRAPSRGAKPTLLERWSAVAAERRALAGLDDAALKDLGLSRADVARETARPFWDLPVGR